MNEIVRLEFGTPEFSAYWMPCPVCRVHPNEWCKNTPHMCVHIERIHLWDRHGRVTIRLSGTWERSFEHNPEGLELKLKMLETLIDD